MGRGKQLEQSLDVIKICSGAILRFCVMIYNVILGYVHLNGIS
jgi:hypothetical protein